MITLGIETSCDETAAALVEVKGGRFKLLANTVLSQIKIHQKYGGVVPEVAARAHIKNILPVVNQALADAKVTPKKIDRIAVTVGPGLITSLIIGVETAKALAYALKKPTTSVNHLKAHLYANWLSNKKIKFPVVALIVSGGHTEIILMKNKTGLKKVGQTVDDAAGEAFDKVAKLLNLDYPGGPAVSKLAEKGNAKAFNFPRPMINSKNFDFSFSGLKTAILYTIQKSKKSTSVKADICASFQQAVVDVLVQKTLRAAKKHRAKTIMLAGGVAANKLLRNTLNSSAKKEKIDFLVPEISLCTDNAAMIAVASHFEKPVPWKELKADPNLEI